MFASIKPGGHFERKRARPPGKKSPRKALFCEKKKTSTRAEIARDERLATFTRRRKRRQNIDRELFERIQFVPVAMSRVLIKIRFVDYVFTHRLYQSPQLRARGPDVLVVLPSAAASAATAASASAASVATASASVASVAAATEAARKSSSVRFFSHWCVSLLFLLLFVRSR